MCRTLCDFFISPTISKSDYTQVLEVKYLYIDDYQWRRSFSTYCYTGPQTTNLSFDCFKVHSYPQTSDYLHAPVLTRKQGSDAAPMMDNGLATQLIEIQQRQFCMVSYI